MHDPQRLAAVSDNFIFVHRAFLRDLGGIIDGGPEAFVQGFPRFARLLAKHVEIEEHLFFPALEERAPGATAVTEAPHRNVEEKVERLGGLAESATGDLDAAQLKQELEVLQAELLEHLDEEQRVVMPAMMENFTAEELWALDARIMEFCTPEILAEMMPWWFANMDAEDRVEAASNMVLGVPPEVLPLLSQMIATGLSSEDWTQLVAAVPGLAPEAGPS